MMDKLLAIIIIAGIYIGLFTLMEMYWTIVMIVFAALCGIGGVIAITIAINNWNKN